MNCLAYEENNIAQVKLHYEMQKEAKADRGLSGNYLSKFKAIFFFKQ